MKLYERYDVDEVLGIISRPGTVVLLKAKNAKSPNLALCPCSESVYLWDLKLGELKNVYRSRDLSLAVVKCICASPDGNSFCAGYSDGTITMWKIDDPEEPDIVFKGHRSGITCIDFGKGGSLMAAGSMETDITVWDVAMEKGLYKLKGHKNQVTGVKFLYKNGLDHLISSGKDSLIKIWDLATQHCVGTLINPSGDICSLCVDPINQDMFFCAAGTSVSVWSLDVEKVKSLTSGKIEDQISTSPMDNVDTLSTRDVAAKILGYLERYKTGITLSVKVSNCGNYVFISGKDRRIDIFRRLSRKEIEKKAKKNRKRKRDAGKPEEVTSRSCADIPRICTITLSQRVLSLDVSSAGSKTMNIVVSLAKNELSLLEFKPDNPAGEMYASISSISAPGHRLPPRGICLSSDDSMIASCSVEEVKIWNINRKQCIRTIAVEEACVCEFVNDNESVLIGTKNGDMQLIYVKSLCMSLFSNAHSAQITSMQIIPETNTLVTASKDKTVKLWDLSKQKDEAGSTEILMPILRKTLSLGEEVTCAKISPNGKLLVAALLDYTVKVFYTDTFKLFLSLYGHKLPITSIDISSDTSIVATASMDKTVKIWGLDFGDCRKSFIAHDEIVTHCRFVQGTHYLFSVSKDKALKYWDAEKLELISKHPSHHGEIWALTIAKHGDFVVTGSDDMSIRVWRKTDDMFALHEERRAELDRMYVEEAKNTRLAFSGLVGQEAENCDYKEQPDDSREVEQIIKSDIDQIPEGDEIVEALDIYETDRALIEEYYESKKANPNIPPPSRNPFVAALGDPLIAPESYVLSRLEKIRPSTLENALIVLPYVKILNLLNCIDVWSKGQRSIVLVARTLSFLLRLNHFQISTSPTLLPLITSIRKNLAEKLILQRDLIGSNISTLSFLMESIKSPSISLDDK